MLSVVIGTQDVERALVPTLGALVAGASAGLVRDVILADGGSKDQTAEVGDIAGCRVLVSPGPLGSRLRAAAEAARSEWLMFLRPGIVLDATWIDEAARFIEKAERHQAGAGAAAAFRLAPPSGARRPALFEAAALLKISLGGRPKPDQGLIIGKPFYRKLGGHPVASADPEAEFLRRLGRRHIALLRSGAMRVAD